MDLAPDLAAAPETEPRPQPVPVSTGPGWTPAQRLAFRFGLLTSTSC